ncbi:MAG: SPOR domain-containing protein [Bacteroidota bacterium]|nr:SPOR domain-containing protein [Bacteroidota bacterium]
MKKLILFIIFLVSVTVQSQTDTSVSYSPLDKLSPDELLQHYINEKEPESLYKGPEKIGDSLFNTLNPLTIPTETVYADALHRQGLELESEKNKLLDSTDNADQKLKPKISLGMGRMGYHGDLYQRHFQSPLTARMAYDLNISQRLSRYLQLNFNVMFGKLGASEYSLNRNENFQSEIRAGGVNLTYDFGNFIPDLYKVRPYVSFGVTGFEFLSKTDLLDKDGNAYFYWSDGSIKDKAEGSAEAQNARDLVRDYYYETDIRERNLDGFGKYQERAWSFPIGAGAIMKVTDRVDIKLNFQYYFTTTDYLDGVTNKSIGNRAGTKQKDNFTYTSFALQYDLIAKPRQKEKLHRDTLNDSFWLAFDQEDRDKDGVIDMLDECQGTPEGVKVDAKGCPLDDDKDGIPNYRDDELATPLGVPVNEKGVGQTDDFWAAWYAQYLNDTLGMDKTTEYVGNIFDLKKKKTKLGLDKEAYTVELVRYSGSIPTDELAFLLSIGDINSTTLDDGTTVVYTSGSYDKISVAIKRRDEFIKDGNKNAGVSKIKGKNITKLTESELAELIKKENDDFAKLALNTNTNSVSTDTNSATSNTTSATENNTEVEVENSFNKTDIVYRVQLGAFKNKISTSVFNTSAGVLELKTGESVFRYVTKGYKTIEEAASVRADLVVQGYSDAFVTAYREGKRIPLNQTKATVEKTYKEDLNEEKIFSSVDKKLVIFKIQLGALKKPVLEKMTDEKFKDLKDIEKQTTVSGTIRYSTGTFNGYDAAEKYRKELEAKGFYDAFIIATFKSEIISIQEAMELLK